MTNRCLAALLTGAALLALGVGVATAQPPAPGALTLNPASGTELEAPSVTTSAGCPTPSNAYNIQLTGPGELDYFVTGRTTAQFSNAAPFTGQFGQTFKDAAALDTPPKTIIPGEYTITLNCVSGITGSTVVATFVVSVDFLSDAGVMKYAVGDPPTSSTTTTTTTTTTAPSSSTTTSSSSSSTSTTTTNGNDLTTTTTEAAVAANSNYSGGGGSLARTGAAPMPLIWLGLLLCFIGGLYLLAARRRGVS